MVIKLFILFERIVKIIIIRHAVVVVNCTIGLVSINFNNQKCKTNKYQSYNYSN